MDAKYLSHYYENEKNYQIARKFLLIEYDSKYNYVTCLVKNTDYINVMKYYRTKINTKYLTAIMNLADLLVREKDYENAKKYYLMVLLDEECNYSHDAMRRIKNYYKKVKKNKVNLIKFYIKYPQIFERKKIIKSIKKLWISKMNDEEIEKFIEILSSFKFLPEDDIPSFLEVFVNLYCQKINVINLHFKYTVKGKGFDEAKKDFVNLIKS